METQTTKTTKTRKITFEAMEFDSAAEAMQWFDASGYGDKIISFAGKYYIVKNCVADRIAAAGFSFAYVHVLDRADGRTVLVTVPVN